MMRFKSMQQAANVRPWLFIAPAILLAAHGMAGVALLGFGWRVGDLPISQIGLRVYVATTAVLALIFLWGAGIAQKQWPIARLLLLLSLPAFTSLSLCAALSSTPTFGHAPYAPWGVGDGEIVVFYNVVFVCLWIAIAILYGSSRYMWAGGLIQLAVYILTRPFPFYTFPLYGIISLLLFGALLVAMRQQIAPDWQPSLWVAVLLTTAVAAFTFYTIWHQFPENGAVLGWTETLTTPARQVPLNAWNWTRPAANLLLTLAVTAVPLSAIAHWFTTKRSYSYNVQ